MNIAGNRWLNLALNLAIVLTILVALRIFLTGGIDVRIGGVIPRIGRLKFTCHELWKPVIFLLMLLALKPAVARPAPFARLRSWRERNRHTIFLGLLVLIAAASPRFWNLGGNSLNPDALLWIDRGRRLIHCLQEQQFKKATARLGHPGIVPAALIGASYTYLGKDTSPVSFNLLSPIVAARMPIAFVGTMTCLLLYLLGRATLGDATAFWAAVVLALYPPHIGLSRVAHIDSTLTLFFMSSLLCYLIYAQGSRLRWNVASAICLSLALLTKTPAYLLILIFFAWKVLVYLYDRRRNPLFLNSGDLVWFGLGFGIYFTLFTKLWSEPLELNWVKFSRFLPQVVMLAKFINLISSLPWLQLLSAVCAIYILCLAARRMISGGTGPVWHKPPALFLGLLIALLCLAFIQVFRKPLINELLHISKVYHVGEAGHLKFWMGSKVSSPPHWFYLFMLLIQTPPLMLLFLICGFVRACGAVYRRERRWDAYLMCLLAPLIVITVMSAGHKMASRYIDPAVPFLCLITAIGFMGIISALSTLVSPERAPGARGAIHALVAFSLIITMIIPLMNTAPAYDIYCNFLIGGPAGASRIISIGSELGIREAVEYLKSHARDEDSICGAGISAELRHYWEHEEPRPERTVLINRTTPQHADWLVIPLSYKMRFPADEELRVARGSSKVYSVTRCGVDFLDIYRINDTPVTERQSYPAEDLRTSLGTIVPDADAAHGKAVKGEVGGQKGILVHGPYARYSRGCWRAVFRLKARAAAADSPICHLSVTGLSAKDAISSIDLRMKEFGSADSYQEFPVDFCTDRVRRLQFCVEFTGIADLWVDRVTVLKR